MAITKATVINLDKERHLKFNLNSFRKLEALTGYKITQMSELMQEMSAELITQLLYVGLMHEDKELTMDAVGELVDMDNLDYVANCLMQAVEGLK
ncbi:hypothetical protein [Clostridium felsineum]|uniref:hypothetical protein n=1 Tax=Clostridium felsineum TaxID=36839 RepID=UPI00098CC926|nr:hypothetical protein [Clostridium felsineum]URZ16859.1 hypothetical protein CLFE_029060 [Clostridium felsineum DSM 794]